MKSIYVTQPYLPPLQEYLPYLKKIWDTRILTNGGPFHVQLEEKLCSYLGVNNISLFSNGTIGLITALQTLGITGEVITTPYSFVATAHSLIWNGNTPVFVDIDPDSLNINTKLIEKAITKSTTAIMPVHCYGNPCDHIAIQQIADKYNLKVIYDAAHAFGVEDEQGSILNHGDLSVLSFHATKVFNTFEGGAIVSPDEKTKKRINNLKNFGFIDEITVAEAGINGKMSEINAALGLVQMDHLSKILELRKALDARYRKELALVKGIKCLQPGTQKVSNYSYFPIFVKSDYPISRDELYEKLKIHNIFARRYFYPLISDFPIYQNFPSAKAENLPVAKLAANEILCLPIYPELSFEEQDRIISIIGDL